MARDTQRSQNQWAGRVSETANCPDGRRAQRAMDSAPEREAREERVVKREQGEGEGEGEGRERMQRSKLEIRRWRQSRGDLSTSVDDCAQ